jgi:hypothetical protein
LPEPKPLPFGPQTLARIFLPTENVLWFGRPRARADGKPATPEFPENSAHPHFSDFCYKVIIKALRGRITFLRRFSAFSTFSTF